MWWKEVLSSSVYIMRDPSRVPCVEPLTNLEVGTIGSGPMLVARLPSSTVLGQMRVAANWNLHEHSSTVRRWLDGPAE